MPVPKGRVPLNAYVSPEAHDGWHSFARQHGITVSALQEVLGRRLRAGEPARADDPEVIAEALAVKEQRDHAARPRPRKKS